MTVSRRPVAALRRVALELVQHKGDVGAVLLDGAGLHKALDAQLAVVGLVAHAAQFGNGDVIALVGAVAGVGQPANGADDDGRPQFRCARLLSGSFHRHPLKIRVDAGTGQPCARRGRAKKSRQKRSPAMWTRIPAAIYAGGSFERRLPRLNRCSLFWCDVEPMPFESLILKIKRAETPFPRV